MIKKLLILIGIIITIVKLSNALTDFHIPSKLNKGKVHNNGKKLSTLSTSSTSNVADQLDVSVKLWPCGDALDKRIVAIALPAIVNFALIPLVGAADTFWVGRMRNAQALAGQSAANQVFSSSFWIISFLPSIITPLIAIAAGSGDKAKMQETVGDAIFVGSILGFIGMIGLAFLPNFFLSMVLQKNASTRVYAEPYLTIRALSLVPALLSTVSFATFRGTMDIVTPLRISLLSNIINIVLDPLLIFNAGLGVSGAAIATVVSEVTAFILNMKELLSRNMLDVSKIHVPKWSNLKPLLLGGLSIQLRAVALNVALLSVARTTLKLDTTGVAAAAHAISIQFFQLGSVVLLAVSTVASVIVPNELSKSRKRMQLLNEHDEQKILLPARQAADRLLLWGVVLGSLLGVLQLLSLPVLKFFSPLEEVQKAAKIPSTIGALLQLTSGVVFIGEGIQQSNQCFTSLAICTMLATTCMLLSLNVYGSKNLTGVWISFGVFSLVRLLGVLRHHFFAGPLVLKKKKIII
jgi:putative MATE family efflux protein